MIAAAFLPEVAAARARARTSPCVRVILVVDDEPAARERLGFALARTGLSALLAGDAEAGADLFRRWRTRIGLVLLDAQMTGGDNVQMLALLRQADPEVRVCFLTEDSSPEAIAALRSLGVTAVLPRSTPPDEVAATLYQLLPSAETVHDGTT
jgi:CheY-like chemotaxis protein